MSIEAKNYGLEVSKANELTQGLEIPRQEKEILIKEFEVVSKLEICEENIPKYRKLRLDIQKNRTQGTNKWHTKAKAFFLSGGKFVDAIKNKENHINEQMEDYLLKGEKHFENLEKERIEKIQQLRVSLLEKYVEDAFARELSGMEEDVWEAYLASKKQAHLDFIQAEKDAEIERQRLINEAIAEKKRIELENNRLLTEANNRAKIAEDKAIIQIAKQKKIDAENLAKQKVIDDKRIAQEKLVEIARIATQKVIDDRIAKEKIESDKIKNELEQKKKAELDLIKSKELALQNELNKGDAEKVKDLITDLEVLKSKYIFKSKESIEMYNNVCNLIDKVTSFIKK